MSVNYAVKKCKNPNGVEGVNYYSCRAIKANDYDFEELAEDISLATTVTKPDAQAVLGVIKLFITDETLVKWVETALETAKEAWKKNAALGEYVKKPAKGAQNDAQSVETAPAE